MAAAVTPQAEALARLAVEETGFGVVADKVQKNLFASQRVYEFIRPMKTVGVINRIEDRKVIEIAEPFGVVAAVIPSTNPDLDGDLQDPDRDQGALRGGDDAASVRRALHHLRGRHHERGRPPGRAARRRHRLDEHRHPRRHAGTDEGARGLGDSRDRRHGPGARRLQRRQARLRRRARQRALLHRVERGCSQGRQRHPDRQVVRQRRAVLVAKFGGGRPGGRSRSAPAVPRSGRLLPVAGRGGRARQAAGHAAAAAEPGVCRQVGRRSSRRRSASPCRRARARSSPS